MPADPPPHDRDAVGSLLAQVLDASGRDAGDGLCLSSVPSSTLGQEQGLDLRWEVNLLRHGEVTSCDNADHPAAVLRTVADGPRGATPHQWDEVGDLLRRISELSHRLSSEDAVVELTACWDDRSRPPEWAWRFEATTSVEIEGSAGSSWDGRSPVEVLRSALDDAASWAPR